MNNQQSDIPVAADDFPEFAEPPQHKPRIPHQVQETVEETVDNLQAEVDDVIARLRRERAEGKR